MVKPGVGIACWLLLCAAAQADVSYEGEARDPDTGALLYREQHLLRHDGTTPSERLVLYRCAGGGLFARKQVRYGAQPAAPVFELEDGRFGYREGVRGAPTSLLVFFRREASSAEESASLAATKALVVDAGFDEFVRARWEALQRGDTVPLDFLVPSRLGTYAFKLRRIASTEIAGAPASAFRLSLSGLLGWFASDITVAYRDADRRLMRFEGLTNIRADREDNLVARIDFPPQLELPGVAATAWAAALAEPLTDCEPGR